jgi:hypothetical protein
MITSNVMLKTYKGPSTIKRAVFGPGMLLQHEDLEQLNTYTRDLSRLLFRSFFGCGVVCGLKVSAQTDNCGTTAVTVEAGVALNCQGDPIYVPNPVTFAATDGCDPKVPPLKILYVWLCSCPKCCAPRMPSCGCDDGDGTPACTREVDWYEIHLGTERPDCACGCKSKGDQVATKEESADSESASVAKTPADPCFCADPCSDCYNDHYLGVCGCNCDDSKCVMLAVLNYDSEKKAWMPDYSVRRFIRPVLARDPQVFDLAAKCKSSSEPVAIHEKKIATKKQSK